MKTFLIIIVAALATVACSKKGGSSSAATAPATTYYQSNGQCYDANNNTTTSNYCSGLQYTITNARCYQISNNAQVDLSYCTSRQYFYSNSQCYDRSYNNVTYTNCGTGNVNGVNGYHYGIYNGIQTCLDVNNQPASATFCNGASGQSCVGNYLWTDYSGRQWIVQCHGTDCAGYGLWTYPTMQYVVCR